MPTYDDVIRWIIPAVEFHQNRYARGVGDAVKAGCRWLDVGAGTHVHSGWRGPSSEDLTSRASFLVGCDMVAKHLGENMALTAATVADAGLLPFADGSFDVVTANMVLEHLETPDVVFAEIARVLAPGGRFLFVTPNGTHPAVWAASILLSRPARKALARLADRRASEHIFYTFYRSNTDRAIRASATRAGFSVREIDRFNSYPFSRRPWPLTFVEALLIKGVRALRLRLFASNIFGDLEKSAAAPGGVR